VCRHHFYRLVFQGFFCFKEASTGVCFKDIENSADVYAKIKQIHEDCGLPKNN